MYCLVKPFHSVNPKIKSRFAFYRLEGGALWVSPSLDEAYDQTRMVDYPLVARMNEYSFNIVTEDGKSKYDQEYLVWYPGIRQTFLDITYANGGINRRRTEQQVLELAEEFINSLDYLTESDEFEAISQWLTVARATEAYDTIVDGDQDAAKVLLQPAPKFTDRLLNDYFEKVG